MKFSSKRLLAAVLAFVLVLSLFPVTQPMHVHAAGTLETINGLTATWTDASNKSGSASWSASGTSITGTAKGYTQMGILTRTITTTLTLKNTSGGEAKLTFDYALTNGGSVSGPISGSSGSYSEVLANDASITITLTSPKGASANTLSITGLALISTSAGDLTTTFNPAVEGGSYTVNGTAIGSSTEQTAAAGTKYELVATAASGYQFFGWYDEAGNVLDYNATYSFTPAANVSITPKFVSSNAALFGVGAAKFYDLTEAGAYAAAGSNKTIILLNNGTVSGSHTIPAGVTLLVPFDAANTLYTDTPDNTNKNLLNTASYVKPTAYRTLTLAADANITVNGAISVSGKHFAGGGDVKKGGGGVPTEQVGFIQMVSGSKITLNSGANLYAWGFITGAGTITAKSGSKVYENFQVRDFRGGGATTSVANDGIVFPLSQYYVQNIEVATAYEYGAEEHVYTSFYISGSSYSAGVKFIGDGAMFQPEAGCVLTKDYIENQDRLQLTVEGNAAMSNMSLSLAGTNIDSSTFILPINSNITINIKSGTTTLKQDLALIPGAELIIAKNAILDLASGAGSGTISDGSGYNLFVYDLDEWTSGYSIDSFDPDNLENSVKSTGLNFVHQAYQFIALDYAPGRTYTRTVADLKDVKVDVNGTLITNGFLYTTLGGANITSSEKTGVIAMNNGAGAEQWTYQAAQIDTSPAYYAILCGSAALKNGDGSYLSTIGAEAGSTFSYCAVHDKWVKQITVTYDANGGAGSMDSQTMMKPCCETLNTNGFANEGFTFGAWNTDANGTGTAYADGVITNATTDLVLYAQWNEIKTTYTVTWVVDGDENNVEVELGTAPVYNSGANPTKNPDGCTTYTFAGWQDQAGNTYAVGATLPVGENRYTALFTEGTSHVGDTDNDHLCNGCGTNLSTCADNNSDHNCDICGDVLSSCVDSDDDNHNCDYTGCNAENVDGGHHGGTATCMATAVCDECGQSYGSKNAQNHTGKNTTGVNAQVPTCGAEGYTGDTVCECGQTVAYGTSIPATGNHNYTNEIARTDATCMAEGSVTKQCACGATETTTLPIDKDNHTGKNTTGVNAQVPTCGAEGYTGDTVCECGQTVAYGTSIPATGNHNYTNEIARTDATCMAEGSVTKQCACGATETTTLPIDKDNHTGNNTTGVNAQAPTCGAEGYTGDTVCECGATVAYGTSIPANGHTNGTPVTENEVAADCTNDGSYDTVIYCSVCGDEVSRTTTTIPATGHSHVDGKCACGDIIPVTLPGSFNDWNGYEMTWNEGGYYTYSMRLDDGNYTFKVIENGSWLGNNGTIVDQTHGYEWIFGDGGDCILNASGGTYTFTYNINTNGLKVDAVLDHVHSYSTTYTWGNYYATCEAAHRCDCGISYTEECVVTSSAGNYGVYFTANSSQGLENAFVEHVGENYAIYFDNTVINWANVNAYVWNNDNGEALVNWPGSAMTDMGNGLYKIVIPAGYDMIIFNDGSNQTADISMPDSYANVAVYNSIYKTCSWGYKTPESVKVTYVVDGKEVDSLDDLYYGSKFDAKFEDFYVYKPSKEGHHFSGYDYTNATDYLTGDVTFYGSMLPNWYGVYLIVDGVRYDYWVAAFGTPLNLPVPTKDQNGCTIYTFSGWNEEIPSTMPAHDVTFTGSFIEGKSHTAGTPVIENEVAADCVNEGSYDTVIYCSVCGDEASRVTTTVSSTGHTPGDVVVEDEVDASCTVDGSYCNVVNCVDCGEELSHDTVIVPATGHSETDLSYNPYGDGTHDVICNVCGDISEEKATCSYVDHMCKYCEDLERMTVVFMNGDEMFTSASCGYGETLNFYAMPIPVAPEGHAWAGWYTEDGVKVEPGMTLTTNLVAYATWTKQSYTLTVSVLANGDIVELTVPYGANLLEILAQAAEDGKIPAIGDKFRVINEYENGMYFISGYSYFVEAEDWWYDLEEASTMPAADFEIDQDWSMLTGWIYSDVDEDGTFDGAEYYDDRNDNPYMTGWQYIEEDYDDIPGGAWYYFFSYMDEYGYPYHFRAEGISRVPYNTELGYGPDQETVDYAQANGIEFIDATTGLFVFDENGKFQMNYTGPVIDGEYARYAVNGHIAWHVGLVENQGAYFYFIGDEVNGGNIMATGDVYVIRNTSDFNAVIGGIYTFDVDGSLKIFHGIVENDLFEGKRYYVAGRLMIGYGLCDITEKVNGEWVTNYFYVRSDGTLAVNTRYWVAKTNGIDFAVGEYEFDENGFMIIPVEEPAKDGIYFENGAWYYYENGTIGYNKGLIFTDKNWYDADGNDVWSEGGIIYVRSNGKLATGTYYVTNLSNYSQIVDVVAGIPLQFSDMGLMGSLKNGIIDGYYYVNNQIAYAAGLIEIDGNYYYVRSNGQVVMGRDYWISNANDTGIKLGCYTFDENGVMQLPDTYGFTGIKDGYYYVDGAVAYGAGLVMLDDGTYIYVRSNGQLAVGKYWPTSLNGYLPVGEYDFGEDGILTVE